MTTIEITIDNLGKLLTESAAEGLRVGKAGTDGDFTAAGIAGHVVLDSGLVPAVDLESTPKSRLQMTDLERAEADLREARAEAMRLREFIEAEMFPAVAALPFLDVEGRMEAADALVKAAREALEVRA